jgi:hypothetical protein
MDHRFFQTSEASESLRPVTNNTKPNPEIR